LLGAYGTGAIRVPQQSALTISNPTDTTNNPFNNGQSSACLVTAAGAAAWTPSETNAVDGLQFECINTGTNVITMTDSAGVYEGGVVACALGQYDAVTFRYIADRWVETGCRDN